MNARLAELRAQMPAQSEDKPNAAAAAASAELARAQEFARSGDSKAALSACNAAETQLARVSRAELDETVRREVVRALLATLQEQGFVVEEPRQAGDGGAAGPVTLIGRLPSGRMARFEIQLDGQMTFDMNGYEGRSCAKDRDKITTMLKNKFQVVLSPRQFTWKNPDQIAKGARDLPAGNTLAQN